MACLYLLAHTIKCAIYVDTGKSYPETQEMIKRAAGIVPVFTVHSDRVGQNARQGIPSDVVPVDWTPDGQLVTSPKPAMIQSYLGCCFDNIALPFISKSLELGATEVVYGQRNEESHKSVARDGDSVAGMKRLHPIENWTNEQVMTFLATRMEIPAHYSIRHSSLDCYDCTAYRGESHDRVAYTKANHPEMYKEYGDRLELLNQSLIAATANW